MEYLINNFNIILLIILSILPTLLIGLFIYKKDIIEKEPISFLLKLFLLGTLSTGVALFLEIYAEEIFPFSLENNILRIIFRSFIIISFSEELVKWIFTYITCWKNTNFNYMYDAIVYCVFISLGFATIENVVAIFSNDSSIIFALKRGLITVPMHAIFGIIAGYYMALAKKYEKRRWYKKCKKNHLLSFLVPMMVHGTFDTLLFISSEISLIILTIFIVYLYFSSYFKVIKLSGKKNKIIRE